ncbi:MAG: SsrA-binding protein SmpB [Lentisphaeraceae bacterium]|nr:SsrA-binding protein SmpB [Lentisphaeraceae bacterium]
MKLAENRKARHDYHIIETFEAGIELQGTEVKSCRARQISLQEGFVEIYKGEASLNSVHIATYEQGNMNNHEPMRRRRLLLHKKEILRIAKAIDTKGMTLIPLSLYLKHGKVKVAIGLCKGKDQADKRQSIKKRETDMKVKRMANKKL